MRSDHELRREGYEMYAKLEGRVLSAVPPDMARTVAGNMRAIACELRGDSPGGNREAVSLNRVADTLDDRALTHELLMAFEQDQMTVALLADDLGQLERVALDLERSSQAQRTEHDAPDAS